MKPDPNSPATWSCERTSETETQLAALVAAESLARPVVIAGVPTAIVPPGYVLTDLERQLSRPARTRGTFLVKSAEAFANAVDRLRLADEPRDLPIFYSRNTTSASVTAVLNFDDWRDLTVVLTQNLSEPFLDWYRLDKKKQAQRDFALFLEDRTAHVFKPEGAQLLELALKFKASVAVRFQSVIEAENGDSALEFIKTTDAGCASAKSRMKVPNLITLWLPVWHGGEPVKFDARFGYSIGEDGKLSLSFEILRVQEILAAEIAKLVAKIADRLAPSVVIEGESAGVPRL